MDLAKGLLKAYETRWSNINSFRVHIRFSPSIKNKIKWTNQDEENIALNIISIDTPQFQHQPIEIFIADSWKMHTGRDELFRFSLTFRDQDQMSYYTKFVMAYMYQKGDYFDNVKMSISLFKDADYLNESEKKLFELDNTLIESISQLQFNNTTESQIAEFTVQFKCLSPKLQR